MSMDKNECPYFRGLSHQTIHCVGPEPQIEMELAFVNNNDLKDYNAQYCSRKYCECLIAESLDQLYRTCPHNSGALCTEEDGCENCGWNPDVSRRRLAKILETQFYSQNEDKTVTKRSQRCACEFVKQKA